MTLKWDNSVGPGCNEVGQFVSLGPTPLGRVTETNAHAIKTISSLLVMRVGVISPESRVELFCEGHSQFPWCSMQLEAGSTLSRSSDSITRFPCAPSLTSGSTAHRHKRRPQLQLDHTLDRAQAVAEDPTFKWVHNHMYLQFQMIEHLLVSSGICTHLYLSVSTQILK